MGERRDGQVVEIQGRNWLVNQLYAAGIEVARPERDRGVDLVAYQDRRDDGRFTAVPIQMKAFTNCGWDISRKYERNPGLLICHVWFVADPARTKCIAMTYPEALKILEGMSAVRTKSWTIDNYYWVEPLTGALTALLEPFTMDNAAWQTRLQEPDDRTHGA